MKTLWQRMAQLRKQVGQRIRDRNPIDKAFRDELYEDRRERDASREDKH